MPQPRLRPPLHNLRGQTIICPPMGIEPRLLRFYAGALTARPLALVAEWLSEQHKTCTEGVRSPPAGHIPIGSLAQGSAGR